MMMFIKFSYLWLIQGFKHVLKTFQYLVMHITNIQGYIYADELYFKRSTPTANWGSLHSAHIVHWSGELHRTLTQNIDQTNQLYELRH